MRAAWCQRTGMNRPGLMRQCLLAHTSGALVPLHSSTLHIVSKCTKQGSYHAGLSSSADACPRCAFVLGSTTFPCRLLSVCGCLASVQSQCINVEVCHIAGRGLPVLMQLFVTCSRCLRKGVSALSCMNAHCAAAQKHLCLVHCNLSMHSSRTARARVHSLGCNTHADHLCVACKCLLRVRAYAQRTAQHCCGAVAFALGAMDTSYKNMDTLRGAFICVCHAA